VVALLIVAGLAFAGYTQRDALVALFDGGDTQTTETPAEPEIATDPETEVAPAEEEVATAPAPVQEEPAQAVGVEKFTQRLMTDGSERQEGPGGEPEETPEGRSVALQTEASTPENLESLADEISPEEVAQSDAATDAATQPSDAEEVAQQNDGQPSVGQSMFLYEERIGQRGPTALEGNVVWSIVTESPGGDAQPEEAIRGEISVPEKDLTALITIRRNADPSLPASHLIELVFSLPATFEGGGIESVQRVAFKESEQDRGNELIAVPARITDDFFMVALNDYAEAVATNLQLMREREWIDIPVVYGNGRRALLTLDKGTAGADVFNRAIQIWQRRSGSSAG
jgi:hypothetical protein